MRYLFALLALATLAAAEVPRLSTEQTMALAQRIWENESEGLETRLTHWNEGETFASMGMGHFIWYPATTKDRPYKESFPSLLAYLQQQGIPLPKGISPQTPCPWPDRSSFYTDFYSPQMQKLRLLMRLTKAEQAAFMAERFYRTLPDILSHTDERTRPHIEERFHALAATPEGLYALMDYVNFKGEGTKESERYQGQGWGLLQVLQAMPRKGRNVLGDFVKAADYILTRRVLLAPREESRWLPGWRKRLETYRSGH